MAKFKTLFIIFYLEDKSVAANRKITRKSIIFNYRKTRASYAINRLMVVEKVYNIHLLQNLQSKGPFHQGFLFQLLNDLLSQFLGYFSPNWLYILN